MARTRVASNLLMIVLILGGLVMMIRMKKEVFPEYELDFIQVTVPYPGAGPEEVEQGILFSIEDKVRAVDGVKEVRSQAVEGSGTVMIELMPTADPNKILQDVKNRVDQIESFPEEAERPVVSLLENRRQVISVILYGELSQYTLRQLAERVRDELLGLEGITLVEIANAPAMEIAIEVPQSVLRSYNLTLSQIAELVRTTSLELPGGGIKTSAGEILLRTQERRDFAGQYKDIPIVSTSDGSQVLLGDAAAIFEDFEDSDQETFYNGQPAVRLDVFRIGEQNPLILSEQVLQYIDKKKAQLPQEVGISAWNDRAEIFQDRIDLLVKNGSIGLVLVMIILGIFLEPRLAFWVTVGLPVSLIGAFLIIPWFADISINMISLFAFIVTLGIVVDDAIIVGENIYEMRERGTPLLESSIIGAKQIAMPVTFAVLTNLCAFLPLFFIPGTTGKIFFQIPVIVTAVLSVSLIESLFVLPAHLSIHHEQWKWVDKLTQISIGAEKKLRAFVQGPYRRALKISLINRYLTFSISIGLLIFTAILVVSGFIPFSYLPKLDADIATAEVTMAFGVPIETSRSVQKKLVEGANEALKEFGGSDTVRGIYTQIGSPATGGGPRSAGTSGQTGSHIVVVKVAFIPLDERGFSGSRFANIWREKVGEIVGQEFSSFSATLGETGGKAVAIDLSHQDSKTLEAAAFELSQALKQYRGASDIDDGYSLGKPQLDLQITQQARSLGLTVRDLANQVRSAFYGAEALRQQRGRNEVKVLVKLPKEERSTIYTLDELMIRTPTGGEIPFREAASIASGRSYSDIRRAEGKRIRTVSAEVDADIANAAQIFDDLKLNVLPELLQKYPGLKWSVEGQQKEFADSLDAMKVGFSLAMLAIYALLALPFGSYIQPLIIMLSIPFGGIGAIFGHVLLGYEISITSILGMVALAGVVVNDSLVLIVAANSYRSEGKGVYQAMLAACARRFRPILLTSLTTFFGLAPIIFETSFQARFLIPMAISLGFGVLFTTIVTLIITPCAYMIIEDLKGRVQRV